MKEPRYTVTVDVDACPDEGQGLKAESMSFTIELTTDSGFDAMRTGLGAAHLRLADARQTQSQSQT